MEYDFWDLFWNVGHFLFLFFPILGHVWMCRNDGR